MDFPATPESVRTARRFVAERVRTCPTEVAASAVLLTSELARQSVAHAKSSFLLSVQVAEGAVHVEVADDDPSPPPPGDTGKGLRLVDQIADRWGTRPADGGGKVVWFEVDP